MTKKKSAIPIILITISAFLTILLLIVIKSKFNRASNVQQTTIATSMPIASLSPTVNPSPSPSPKNLKKETIRRENPDKTLAFYYTSDTPVFSSTAIGYEDDPFKLKLNGDTRYFTKGATNKGLNNSGNSMNPDQYIAIIKPKIINIQTNIEHVLFSIDQGMISGIGYKNILNWVDNNTLMSKDCTEGGCIFDLIEVLKDSSTHYGDISLGPVLSYDGIELVNHLQNYYFVQTNKDGKSGDIRVYRDQPTSQIKKDGWRYDFSNHTPILSLKTSKNMNELEFDNENVTTFNQKIKLYLSSIPQYSANSTKDGYFVFDLQSGTIIEKNNL